LLHKIPFDAAQALHLDRHPLLALPVAIVAGYAMATLSWYLLEKPFFRLKRFFESKTIRPDHADCQFVLAPQKEN
jgi:peptidoglycan/LPS O-acetylase OafA/YrhL